MANTFKLKRSAVQNKVPTTGDLQLGELALNTFDGKLYTKKDNGTASIVEIGAGGGVSDGDKGDITVSNSGTTWTVDNDAVTYAKIQNVSATDKLLGRSTAGAGDIEEITCTAAGRALLDDANAAAQRTTLGLGTLATQNGTFSGTSSGTNTGDQTISLTGDVTGSGTGSFAATLANTTVTAGSYTYAALTVDGKGRITAASSGTPVTSFSAGTTGLTPSTATTGAVTLAGTLAVANGGTGVTTSTGSGSNVLSTSPSLTTPLLGTPTSGTLTNCTGYTFANLASKPTTLSGYGITDAPTTTGTGASGTWGISITGSSASCTGNAATATAATSAGNITGGNLTGDYQVTSGIGVRFGHANQTDTNDGFISAGRFASGLNIVGTQTTGGAGRQVRIWGSLIDDGGTAYVRNSGSWGINITGSAATLTTARTLTIGSTGKTFNGSANVSWTVNEIGAAAAGAAGSIVETPSTISASYTLTAGSNGMSAGPITIASGVTVTVPSGASWVIV